MEKLNVTLVQMSSSPDLDENLSNIERIIQESRDTDLVIFPECALCWAKTAQTHEVARSESLWMTLLGQLCKKYNTAAVFGGIPLKEGDEIYNSSLAIDQEGNLLARYDKIHLFQLSIEGKLSIDETETYSPGEWSPTTFEYRGWKIVLSICYDIRFPELYRELVPFDLIICTAAFTKKTGRAHWELLSRARAVENQTYFIGVDQTGRNALSGQSAYGHSIVVDPWGKELLNLRDIVKHETITLEKKELNQYRKLLVRFLERDLGEV